MNLHMPSLPVHYRELKWTTMVEFNSDDHYIYYYGQESFRRNGLDLIVNKRVKRSGGSCLVTKSCPNLATPWTVACQAPLPRGFSRQEYWRGLPFPSPGDLPNPGIEPLSPICKSRKSRNTWSNRQIWPWNAE